MERISHNRYTSLLSVPYLLLSLSIVGFSGCQSNQAQLEPRKPCSYTLIRTFDLPARQPCPKIATMFECFKFQAQISATLRAQANKQLETVQAVNKGYLEYKKLHDENGTDNEDAGNKD